MSIAASAATTLAERPPSLFAALLRRSKFASYDQRIPQVYTSHGGDAKRGNYGVKRPLTPRRKGLPLVMRSIDSREQQTEWSTAARDARFVARWEHLPPPQPGFGPWNRAVGPNSRHAPIDSEFSPAAPPPKVPPPEDTPFARIEVTLAEAERAGAILRDLDLAGAASPGADPDLVEARRTAIESLSFAVNQLAESASETSTGLNTTPVENIHAMSEQAFERYVLKMSRLRPLFHRFIHMRAHMQVIMHDAEMNYGIKAILPSRALRDNLWEASTEPSAVIVQRLFLAMLARQRHSGSTGSLSMAGRPHRSAGLNYTPPSALTDFYLTKPQPGRYSDVDGTLMGTQALFAGVRVSFDMGKQRNADAQRTGDDEAHFRVSHSILYRAPSNGLGSTGLLVRAVDTESYEVNRPTTYRPGSREYIAVNSRDPPRPTAPRVQAGMLTKTHAYETPEEWSGEHQGRLLNALSGIMPEGALLATGAAAPLPGEEGPWKE